MRGQMRLGMGLDQIKLNAVDRMVRKAKPLNIEKFPIIL
jgi:hypothetical protein